MFAAKKSDIFPSRNQQRPAIGASRVGCFWLLLVARRNVLSVISVSLWLILVFACARLISPALAKNPIEDGRAPANPQSRSEAQIPLQVPCAPGARRGTIRIPQSPRTLVEDPPRRGPLATWFSRSRFGPTKMSSLWPEFSRRGDCLCGYWPPRPELGENPPLTLTPPCLFAPLALKNSRFSRNAVISLGHSVILERNRPDPPWPLKPTVFPILRRLAEASL